MTVLVVDDDPVIQLFVTNILDDMGIDSVAHGSGESVLAWFVDEANPFPALVILDVTLPGIDGFETATKIKSLARGRHLPIIFLTGYREADILSHSLSIGDDYIAKPFTVEMVAAKVRAHLRVRDLCQQLDNQYQELKRYNHKVSVEHDMVDAIFRRNMEENFAHADNMRFHTSPKSLFNGDILLVTYGPADNLYVLVGDVTGHGLPAAVGAMPVFPTFFTMARKGLSVGVIAAEMNKALSRVLPDNMLMATCLVELSGSGEQVTVWSGGLPPAIIASGDGELKQLIEPTHCPLGMLTELEFEQDVQVYSVSPGDRIYLFTDGVEESRDAQGQMYGEDRLYELFDGSTGDMYNRILTSLTDFSGLAEQDDDITLVELRCQPATSPGNGRRAGAGAHLVPWSLTFSLGVEDIRHGSPIPQVVRLISNAAGVDVHQDYISTILSELFSNALEHGLLELDSSIKDSENGFIEYYAQRKQRLEQLAEGQIDIIVELKPEGGAGTVAVAVRNSGRGFDHRRQSVSGDEDSHGRGVNILRELCESVTYSEGGRCATAIYRLPA